MNLYVIDTSVAFKWCRQPGEEAYVAQAIGILESHLMGRCEIHVPDLLFYELGNILIFKEDLASESALAIIRKTFLLEINVHPLDLGFAEEAFRLAKKYAITFYDGSFLALSHGLNCPFITADKKLFLKIKSLPRAEFIGSL